MEYFRSTCLFYSLSGFQLLTVIALSYSVIAPLILGFTAIAFILFYFAYIYTMIFVLRPSTVDARGTNYVKSLFQLFTGLFLAQLWITAIFVFSKNWACVALEGVIVVVTIAARLWMKWKFLPLVDAVPISAIKYAAGDPTYSYPIHDQGLKEIKVEGKNYWEGGNQLGLGPDPKDQVLPDRIPGNGPSSYAYDQQQQNHRGSDSSAVDTKVGHGELLDKPRVHLLILTTITMQKNLLDLTQLIRQLLLQLKVFHG